MKMNWFYVTTNYFRFESLIKQSNPERIQVPYGSCRPRAGSLILSFQIMGEVYVCSYFLSGLLYFSLYMVNNFSHKQPEVIEVCDLLT